MDGEHVNKDATGKVKEGRDDEVSKHTFYIENAQMRLKLFARNEVQVLGKYHVLYAHLCLSSVKCCNGLLHWKRLPPPRLTLKEIGLTVLHPFD